MIEITAGTGAAKINIRRGLGEWGAREMARERQDPGLRQRPVRLLEPEGALALMMPWVSTLRRAINSVLSHTARTCA